MRYCGIMRHICLNWGFFFKLFDVRTIRSQLSTHELMLLYYNCISRIGKRNFKALVEQYEMLDNLNPRLLPYPNDEDVSRSLFAEGTFGISGNPDEASEGP